MRRSTVLLVLTTVRDVLMARRLAQVVVCAFVAGFAGCGGGTDSDTSARKRSAPTPIATTTPSDGDAATDDRLIDVRGRKLFIACRGTRSPTVVYLHGMGGARTGAGEIPAKLGDSQRFCAYDRINSTGFSDQVEGPVTGEDQIDDLHGLLAAAKIKGPYVLLGASHGGLLAAMYAATYPDDVAGMVLLDAPLPDTLKYEARYIPRADRLKLDDWMDSPEKVDDLRTFRQAQAVQGNEPRIPVTYLAAKVLELPAAYPRAQIMAAERRLQRDYLARFSPGRLLVVDSPHYMEPEIPGRIAREVKRVVAAAAER